MDAQKRRLFTIITPLTPVLSGSSYRVDLVVSQPSLFDSTPGEIRDHFGMMCDCCKWELYGLQVSTKGNARERGFLY